MANRSIIIDIDNYFKPNLSSTTTPPQNDVPSKAINTQYSQLYLKKKNSLNLSEPSRGKFSLRIVDQLGSRWWFPPAFQGESIPIRCDGASPTLAVEQQTLSSSVSSSWQNWSSRLYLRSRYSLELTDRVP